MTGMRMGTGGSEQETNDSDRSSEFLPASQKSSGNTFPPGIPHSVQLVLACLFLERADTPAVRSLEFLKLLLVYLKGREGKRQSEASSIS